MARIAGLITALDGSHSAAQSDRQCQNPLSNERVYRPVLALLVAAAVTSIPAVTAVTNRYSHASTSTRSGAMLWWLFKRVENASIISLGPLR